MQDAGQQSGFVLVGAFSSDSRNYDLNPPDYRTYEPSFFLQDSWKVTSKLTVLYGVRYDVFTPFTEAHGHISNFDFLQALGSTAATVTGALKVAERERRRRPRGHQDRLLATSRRGVGFSASITPQTVVRGGYGLSFFPGNYTSNADLKNAPFVSVFSPTASPALAVSIETKVNGGTLPNGQNGSCAAISGAPTTFDQGLPLPTAPNVPT